MTPPRKCFETDLTIVNMARPNNAVNTENAITMAQPASIQAQLTTKLFNNL